ncbi:(deoxy)nucleoside triphosphate pyrophosphohydrolase [Maribacter sp. 1_2014MBL_MicDiv]|uniref:(deoxy)nucleoside triphosphate pyrophosphohydrolase n=1 Tax=Maribacter sp. 1_2014MBL_MicDiv TaxID=1644130 RepID=UPI0008F505E5|nr:(deoxy)nucleoside triphosphate pyrophosphohydrolase [Maribacter sp. 1_2014MBL_MicDiv]APA64250.1 hypothetical protein YQ22_07905 [Maribacter sp. 1_2014MBL_MicDiv]
MMKVVCGIIYNGDKILLCRRSPNKHLAGFWEFPGGKIELNEKPECGLIRELDEELSISVKKLNYYTTVIHEYENFTIQLIAYKCIFIETEIKLLDHDRYEWMELNNILDKNLAPADIPIVNKLNENF